MSGVLLLTLLCVEFDYFRFSASSVFFRLVAMVFPKLEEGKSDVFVNLLLSSISTNMVD